MSFCSASPWETANILLSHGHRKRSSWSGKKRATTRANPGQGAGVWAQSLKREAISDHEPNLEMKADDFIAGWTRARKLYLCCTDIKNICFSMCATGETKQTLTQDASGSPWAPGQQCLFVLGHINIGALTVNTKHKTKAFLLLCFVCQGHFKADIRAEASDRQRVRQLAHVWAPQPRNPSPPSVCVTQETKCGRPNWAEGELEGREQARWGEVANLVIMSAAANSTSSGKVGKEQHEITRVMKTPGSVPHGEDVGGDKQGDDGGITWTQVWGRRERESLLARSGYTHHDKGTQLDSG